MKYALVLLAVGCLVTAVYPQWLETTVPAGTAPIALRYNPQNNRVYCANFFAGTVTIVDAATDTVIGDAFTHGGRWGLCYNSLTDEVYRGALQEASYIPLATRIGCPQPAAGRARLRRDGEAGSEPAVRGSLCQRDACGGRQDVGCLRPPCRPGEMR
jgi:YVTN family beta-propeller protein